MTPMNIAITFVKSHTGNTLGPDIVSYFKNAHGLSAHCCAGAVGSGVRLGRISVVATIKSNNKTINLFK